MNGTDALRRELKAQSRQTLRRVLEANLDPAERVRRLGASVSSDRAADTLVLSFGPVREAPTEDVDGHLLLRVETLAIVDLEVLGCRDWLAGHPAFFGAFLGLLAAETPHLTVEPPEPRGAAAGRPVGAIRELVPA
jgi:hypothetical protein